MRRETVNCDRCGRILKDIARPLAISDWEYKNKKTELHGTIPYDLCPECQEAFLKFMKETQN